MRSHLHSTAILQLEKMAKQCEQLPLLLSVLIFVLLAANANAQSHSPILLIPGFTGSQLETRVSASSSEASCDCCTDWTGLWVNISRGTSQPDCFLNELTLIYDPATNHYNNSPSVDVRVPGFGDTNSVEYLSNGGTDVPVTAYMNELVDYFVKQGYVRNKTIRAAPYDWRLSADQLQQQGYFTQLQSLVETMYQDSNERVTIIVHSMGGPVSLYFLTSVVSQKWKDQYIYAYIPLSPAYAGAFGTLEAVLFGNHVIKNVAGGQSSMATTQSFASSAWLLGAPSVWGNTRIITTPSHNYTAEDYQTIFEGVGYKNGYQMYLGIANINKGYPAPNVPVYCFYGTNVSTPETLIYFSDDLNTEPAEVVDGPGDGVVNQRSAEVCLNWQNEQQSAFSSRKFPGVSHVDMVKNSNVLQAIADIVVHN